MTSASNPTDRLPRPGPLPHIVAQHVEEAIEVGDASEVFVAAALALDRGDAGRLRLAVDAVREEPERLAGLASALGWSAWEKAQGWRQAARR